MQPSGPQHGIVGDEGFGLDIPQTDLPEQDLSEERNMAKFSKTNEFKRLQEYARGRIEFYQTYLPDGRNVTAISGMSNEELVVFWKAANVVIGEFNALLSAYNNANEVVKAADAVKNAK